MNCDVVREAVSAALDGEARPVEDIEVHAHLARCGECRAYAAGVAAVQQRLHGESATSQAIARAVLDRIGHRRTQVLQATRIGVATVGAIQIVLAFGSLTKSDPMTAHEARHIAAFSLALGAGLLYAAWRPHRAVGQLPIVATLAVAFLITCVITTSSGGLPVYAAVTHLLAPLGVIGLWVCSRDRPRAARQPEMRLVA